MFSSEGFNEVMSYIDQHEQAYLDRLIEYLRQPSISAHGLGIQEVADILTKWLTDLGFDAKFALVADGGQRIGRGITETLMDGRGRHGDHLRLHA